MTPTSPPRRPRRASRRRLPALLAVLALLVVAAAGCGGTAPSDAAPVTPAGSEAPPSPGAPTDTPNETPGEPTAAPTAGPSEEPAESPTEEPAATETPLPTETPGETPGGAAACTGSDDNRAFYAGVAADVEWDVYCPVLPAGWFVETGSFRLAGGGRMEISYKGPGGQRLVLREGYYCGKTECVPVATESRDASLGAEPARLLDSATDPIVVAGSQPGWVVNGSGMDGGRLAAYTAAFAKVGE